jgi:hypothetical protein
VSLLLLKCFPVSGGGACAPQSAMLGKVIEQWSVLRCLASICQGRALSDLWLEGCLCIR